MFTLNLIKTRLNFAADFCQKILLNPRIKKIMSKSITYFLEAVQKTNGMCFIGFKMGGEEDTVISLQCTGDIAVKTNKKRLRSMGTTSKRYSIMVSVVS